jgi:hypothetical protein
MITAGANGFLVKPPVREDVWRLLVSCGMKLGVLPLPLLYKSHSKRRLPRGRPMESPTQVTSKESPPGDEPPELHYSSPFMSRQLSRAFAHEPSKRAPETSITLLATASIQVQSATSLLHLQPRETTTITPNTSEWSPRNAYSYSNQLSPTPFVLSPLSLATSPTRQLMQGAVVAGKDNNTHTHTHPRARTNTTTTSDGHSLTTGP